MDKMQEIVEGRTDLVFEYLAEATRQPRATRTECR
jgi:hypothetical protein